MSMTVEPPHKDTNIEVEELFKLFAVKLQGRLMFGHARISYKTIDSTMLRDNRVHSLSHTVLICHVGSDIAEVCMVLLKGEEFFAGLLNVE